MKQFALVLSHPASSARRDVPAVDADQHTASILAGELSRMDLVGSGEKSSGYCRHGTLMPRIETVWSEFLYGIAPAGLFSPTGLGGYGFAPPN
jgi:hypothetical protein